jgi:hypothetical protein
VADVVDGADGSVGAADLAVCCWEDWRRRCCREGASMLMGLWVLEERLLLVGVHSGWGRKDLLTKKETVDLRRWGTALPVLWSVEMRLFCGAACGRLKMRELGLSVVGRSCHCWRLAGGEKAGSVERKVCVQRVMAVVWRWEAVNREDENQKGRALCYWLAKEKKKGEQCGGWVEQMKMAGGPWLCSGRATTKDPGWRCGEKFQAGGGSGLGFFEKKIGLGLGFFVFFLNVQN